MVAYVRVSRVGTRDVESDSYQTEAIQLEACERWAKERGIELVAGPLFVDRDQSGSSDDRPGLTAAITEVREGRADGIVVATLDRFSRQSTIDALKRVQEVQDADGIVASVGGEVPVDPTSDTGEFILTLFDAIARMEWRRYAARWEVAKSRAIMRGAKISRAPLGYLRNGDGTLTPDPETAPIVRRAFKLAAEERIRAAMEYLNGAGVVNPAKDPKTKERGKARTWTTSTVRRLLSNRTYLGEARYGDHVQEGAHEALVDLATWTKAQTDPVTKRGPSGTFPLSGVALCATCGNAMSGSGIQYRCAHNQTRAVRRDGAEPCTAPALVLRESLEEFARALLVVETEAREMDPEAYAEILPSVPATPDLSEAESALRSAELARVEFAADTRAKELLGEVAWYQGLEAHAREVEDKQHAYEEVLALAAPARVTPKSEEIATAPIATLPGYLDALGLVLRVAPGRGHLDRRVSLEPRDAVPA